MEEVSQSAILRLLSETPAGSCVHCRYWRQLDVPILDNGPFIGSTNEVVIQGECRRRAPVLVDEDTIEGHFPLRDFNDWCGEHERRSHPRSAKDIASNANNGPTA